MPDHINQFTALQQEVDHQRGTTMLHLSDIQINLAFFSSLGDEWKSFIHPWEMVSSQRLSILKSLHSQSPLSMTQVP